MAKVKSVDEIFKAVDALTSRAKQGRKDSPEKRKKLTRQLSTEHERLAYDVDALPQAEKKKYYDKCRPYNSKFDAALVDLSKDLDRIWEDWE